MLVIWMLGFIFHPENLVGFLSLPPSFSPSSASVRPKLKGAEEGEKGQVRGLESRGPAERFQGEQNKRGEVRVLGSFLPPPGQSASDYLVPAI